MFTHSVDEEPLLYNCVNKMEQCVVTAPFLLYAVEYRQDALGVLK